MARRPFFAVFVPGWAKTKGSVEAIPRRGKGTYVRQSVQGSTEWARLVEDEARRKFAGREKRSQGPVWVALAYWLPCTTQQLDLKGARGNGDLDKLERNILDALTKAGIYGDDAQVRGVVHEKFSAFDAKRPVGVEITVLEDVTPIAGKGVDWPADFIASP